MSLSSEAPGRNTAMGWYREPDRWPDRERQALRT